ncbi:MAG: phosphotransferase [Deltaproteobacteria bacterium]|nr:phosphotransferase [Deltaproteobacteria bacterium]
MAEEDLDPWREELTGFLTGAFGELPERPLSLLHPAASVADDVMKLRIRDARGRTVGVALCSSPEWPDMVASGVKHARRAHNALGEDLGSAVLLPLHEGFRDGRSYAVLPFCEPLHPQGLLWPIQRFRIGSAVGHWLAAASARTTRPLDQDELEPNFRAPLRALSAMSGVSARLRGAAAHALARLDDGAWTPRHALMHGDLWEGNVLLSENRHGFVLIDWAGCKTDGYGIFDLVRWAASMRFGRRKLRAALAVHCEHLGCSFEDARSNVVAALAELGTNLNQFPREEFSAMADRCLDTLERAGA